MNVSHSVCITTGPSYNDLQNQPSRTINQEHYGTQTSDITCGLQADAAKSMQVGCEGTEKLRFHFFFLILKSKLILQVVKLDRYSYTQEPIYIKLKAWHVETPPKKWKGIMYSSNFLKINTPCIQRKLNISAHKQNQIFCP